MKKRLERLLILVLVVTTVCPITSMARVRERKIQLENDQAIEESILLPESVKRSVGVEQSTNRSKALANALCTITNTEKGIIGVYAETAMFIPVDWAALTIWKNGMRILINGVQ